jgi:uncharacterized protein (TIGR02453 family)
MPKKPAAALSAPFFTQDTLKFLSDLATHNSREWFLANKTRYELDVKAPALRLIEALAPRLAEISPQIIASAKPVGGSLFRIHRDVRFSSDKSPYKTHIGMSFYHAATKATPRAQSGGTAMMGRLDAPVLYLHIQPGECFLGGGVWHPQKEALGLIRRYIVNNAASWTEATRAPGLPAPWSLGGESLSRPPAGFKPDHPLIEDLKRKDFIASHPLSDDDILAPDLDQRLAQHYQQIAPLIDWLCGALDLEF